MCCASNDLFCKNVYLMSGWVYIPVVVTQQLDALNFPVIGVGSNKEF